MSTSFFKTLLDESRFLTVLHDNLPDEIKNDELYPLVISYLEKYVGFNTITTETAINSYTTFITQFNKHCKQFIKTGKYPAENGTDAIQVSRMDYDLILLLSVLFTPHRFRIMQLLFQNKGNGKALFIGLGPGLELSLTRKNFTEINAYDLSFDKFLFSEFPGIHFRAELYSGQQQNYYDNIYLIELLEHLKDPYQLLKICRDSLKSGGKIFLTTATDLPQFDHLYNFPEDHLHFEQEVVQMGLSVIKKEAIPHHYLTMEIKPYNYFYILEKK